MKFAYSCRDLRHRAAALSSRGRKNTPTARSSTGPSRESLGFSAKELKRQLSEQTGAVAGAPVCVDGSPMRQIAEGLKRVLNDVVICASGNSRRQILPRTHRARRAGRTQFVAALSRICLLRESMHQSGRPSEGPPLSSRKSIRAITHADPRARLEQGRYHGWPTRRISATHIRYCRVRRSSIGARIRTLLNKTFCPSQEKCREGISTGRLSLSARDL